MITVAFTATFEIPDEEGEDIADALRHIATLLEQGYTSGHLGYGSWDYTTEGEPEPFESEDDEDD